MYQKFKKSKAAESRKKFLRAKHVIKRKIKVLHESYLEDILGLNSESDDTQNTVKSDFSRKRLFSLLKNSKLDSQGIVLLKDGESTATSNVDKANVLKRQFQSVVFIQICSGPCQAVSGCPVQWCPIWSESAQPSISSNQDSSKARY